MTEEQNFETLFEAALAELNTAEQPTAEAPDEGQAVAADVEAEAPTEAVSETEAVAEEEPAAVESSNEEKAANGPVAVTEDDTIVLPDGTTVSVRDAALRQRDYTRKTQALAEERKTFEAEKAQAQSAVDYVNNLQEAWGRNQAEVVSGFVAATADPTLILSQVIVELAKAEKLDPKFMETFGITADVQEKWASEAKSQGELAEVKARLSKFEQEKEAAEAARTAQEQEEALIAQYESQWAEIKAASGLALDPTQEVEAKLELLGYALENEIPNLKAAWKALQFEKSQTAKPAADPKKAAVEAKKVATGAITAKSTGGSVVTGKAPSNIEDAAWAAFQELTSKQ